MTKHSIRPERGTDNTTYRNGAFRLNKRTAAETGVPPRIEVFFNKKTKQVLLFPADANDPNSFKLTAMGRVPWGNCFSSHELARMMGLPLDGETVRLFTTRDPERKALHLRYRRKDESRDDST